MAYIDIQNITKWYSKDLVIIKDLTLSVNRGEFLVIVGPSGCGKSTLLRMIAGLEDISSGTIDIDGKVVNDISPADRDIAMVFQNYALYPHMNIYKNLSYGLKNRKIPKDVIDKKVKEISKLLQIEELLQRKPNELSGGQRQRVAMGRAIIREPKAFLFDEPLSNLDAKLRNRMRIEIRKLHNKLGITSIYVTHDQVEAMTLADRIVVLNGGKVEQIGSPDEIYSNPKTLFVAKFMGIPPMNIFRSKIIDGNIDFCGKTFKPNKPVKDGEVYLGIRPEDISLSPVKNSVEFTVNVDMIERLGSENLIYTTLNKEALIVKTNDNLRKDLQSINIYVDVEKSYVFSIESEQRIM